MIISVCSSNDDKEERKAGGQLSGGEEFEGKHRTLECSNASSLDLVHKVKYLWEPEAEFLVKEGPHFLLGI